MRHEWTDHEGRHFASKKQALESLQQRLQDRDRKITTLERRVRELEESDTRLRTLLQFVWNWVIAAETISTPEDALRRIDKLTCDFAPTMVGGKEPDYGPMPKEKEE
jgi:AcrR family transcriptional regulator